MTNEERRQLDEQGFVVVPDVVYGAVSKATGDLEDFALLRSNGMPTYHMASCADDAELRITDILRGQEHLAAGVLRGQWPTTRWVGA